MPLNALSQNNSVLSKAQDLRNAPRFMVCTKSWDFDAAGNETKIDYGRMTRLLREAKFPPRVSIEYVGENLGSIEGVKKTLALIRKS